ncbi:MAG: family 1 glycosylhydrolase, partial [Sphingobacterium sp.]
IEKYIKQGDENDLKFDMDFIGIQNYTREMIRYAMFVPYLQAKIVTAKERKVEMTEMNWEVYPSSIYQMLKKFSSYPNMPPLLVTENGAAFKDQIEHGQVHDPRRLNYLQEAIQHVYQAKEEGVNVKGYFVWTFLDNFEWAEGYRPRFGLVYVDFQNQQRIIKSSGHWYANFLK